MPQMTISHFPGYCFPHGKPSWEHRGRERQENPLRHIWGLNILHRMAVVRSEKLEMESETSGAAQMMSQPGWEGYHCWLRVHN